MKKNIYLLQCGTSYKIGLSKHNPNKRIKGLQTGNPEEIEVVCCFESKFSNVLETTLHRIYDQSHKRGEWFTLSSEEVKDFLKTCEKVETNLVFLTENRI